VAIGEIRKQIKILGHQGLLEVKSLPRGLSAVRLTPAAWEALETPDEEEGKAKQQSEFTRPRRFETAFNAYTVEAPIGEGGAGWVFRVRDANGAVFALKYLRPETATTNKRRRFQNEARFCERQDHPNVIRVLDSGVVVLATGTAPFYVMPYYPKTLRDLMRTGISPERVLPLFSQIMDGLEAAHLVGVHHRDLKPENVLYDPVADRVIVADFGVAHFAEEQLYTAVETKRMRG